MHHHSCKIAQYPICVLVLLCFAIIAPSSFAQNRWITIENFNAGSIRHFEVDSRFGGDVKLERRRLVYRPTLLEDDDDGIVYLRLKPPYLNRARGLRTTFRYVGCRRDYLSINLGAKLANVYSGTRSRFASTGYFSRGLQPDRTLPASLQTTMSALEISDETEFPDTLREGRQLARFSAFERIAHVLTMKFSRRQFESSLQTASLRSVPTLTLNARGSTAAPTDKIVYLAVSAVYRPGTRCRIELDDVQVLVSR